MSLKVTGAEWKKFYDDDTVWAGEAYQDDCLILVDGVNADEGEGIDLSKISDTAKVEVCSGYIVRHTDDGDEHFDILKVFKAWSKKQNVVFVTLGVPKDRLEEFTALVLNHMGIKVQS